MVTEEYFPRGKTKVPSATKVEDSAAVTSGKDAKDSKKKEKKFVNIFTESEGKPLKKKKSKGDKKGSEKSVLTVKTVPNLAYSQLKEGMVLSGVVGEVGQYEVKVSLPSHLVATLPITNISSVFTEEIRKSAESEDDSMDEIPSLSELYLVGQFIVVAVVSCVLDETMWKLVVSTDPKLVMAGRVPGEGELCVTSLISKEDHGYITDIGCSTTKGFLSNKAAQKYWMKSLHVGQVLLCTVVKKDRGAVTLKCEPGKVFNASKKEPNLHIILPGTIFEATVSGHMDNGLKVSFGKDMVGYIHQDYLSSPAADVKEYAIGTEIRTRLVFVIPTLNTVLLSTKQVHPITDVFQEVKTGSILSGVKIARVAYNRLILQLTESLFGYVSSRNAKEGADIIRDLTEKFKVGDSVKTRVVGLDRCAGLAICTLHKNLVSGAASIDELSIGGKVKATIREFKERGVEVSLGNLSGWIPNLFLTDVPLKNPEKKFHRGEKLECRVMNLEHQRRKVILTSKPILVREEYSIISSYEDAKVGTVTEGVIIKILPRGLVLGLMGSVKGFVPKGQVSTESVEMLDKLFYLGQAVKCQVLSSDANENKLILSLVLNTMKPLGKKEKDKGKVLKRGTIYTAKVVGVEEEELNVEVEEAGSRIACSIPVYHLTDNAGLDRLLLRNYKVGDSVEAACFVYDVVPVLTLKPSILAAIKKGTLPLSGEVELDNVIPGVIQGIKKYGIFVRLAIWDFDRSVLVPTRKIANFFMENTEAILEVGQSLAVKITEKEEEGGQLQLTGSTNIKDLVPKVEDSTGLMKTLLQDLQFLRERSESLKDIHIGALLTATVKEVTEMGAILDVQGHVSLAPSAHLGDSPLKAGARIPVMVLFVDYQAGVLEVSCDTSLITRAAVVANHSPENGTKVRGRIILTRTELNLQIVSIVHPTKYSGKLVYTCTVSHMNDLAGDDTETEDRPINVLIQEEYGGDLLGVNEKYMRPAIKRQKRDRANSIGDDATTRKRMRTESESSVSELLAAVTQSQDTPDFVPPKALASADFKVPETPVSDSPEGKKKKRKRKKASKEPVVKPAAEEEPMETNEQEEEEQKEKESKKETQSSSQDKITDPGWDFSLTGVTLPAWGKVSIWGEDAEEEEEQEEDGKAKKHLNKKEAKAMRRKEEQEAESEEKKVLEGEHLPPQSSQEFEKLVLASPDSSLVWIQFMAFYLQSCQYAEARAVAARAVDRINFREEGEKLNVYLAWLNLENAFGSQESVQKVLKDALQRNDEYKVYSQMADIFAKSNKIEEAEKIFKILVKKYSKVKEVWIRFGLFYYKNSRTEEGRFAYTRSLQNLEKRDVVDISAKFAQIEFKYGDPERGKTMYEKLVTSQPKRVDLWTSYADQLTRIGDITAARALYARISTLGLQAKKMKTLFGKWLEFEGVHGTDAQEAEVRKSALQYLNAKDSSEPAEA